MKLHSDSASNMLRVSAYDRVSVTVAKQRFTGSFAILPDALVPDVEVKDLDALSWADLDALHERDLEILILGTGARQRFPGTALSAELAARRIGLEVMDSRAACRTYNILAAEGRRVGAVILLGAPWT
jgi:uncharacterized protein